MLLVGRVGVVCAVVDEPLKVCLSGSGVLSDLDRGLSVVRILFHLPPRVRSVRVDLVRWLSLPATIFVRSRHVWTRVEEKSLCVHLLNFFVSFVVVSVHPTFFVECSCFPVIVVCSVEAG